MIESLGTLAYELLLELLLVSLVLWVVAMLATRLFHITPPAWRARLFLLPVVAPVLAVPLNHLVVRPLFLKFSPTLFENLLTCLRSILPWLAWVSLVIVGLLLSWGAIHALRPLAAASRLRLEWQRQQHSPLWLRCNSMLQLVASRMQMSPPRVVLTAGNNCGSFALGPFGAYVAVAKFLVPTLDDEELESLLSHELGHIKRKDTMVGGIASICHRLLSFSPFAKSAYRRFCWAREEAVDDLAVRSSGHRLALASCLVKACRLAQSQSYHFSSSNGFLSSLSATESRIRRLFDSPTDAAEPPGWYPWAYTGIIVSLVVFLLLVV